MLRAARKTRAVLAGHVGSNHPVALGARHRPSGERLPSPGAEFHTYVQGCLAAIARARRGAHWQDDPSLFALAAPFERRPEREAAARFDLTLLHGLSDSPFQMRDLADALAERQGCASHALLLPGHGTVPGDLLDVRWQDWAGAVRAAIPERIGGRPRVALGFSTGAALAIDAALGGAPFAGLILLSPAIAVTAFANLVGWHRAISWALPRTAWLDIHADRDPARYESLPNNAAHQVYRLALANRERWTRAPLRVPMLVVQSEDDATVDADAALAFFRAHNHRASRMLVYGRTGTTAPLDAGGDARVRRVTVESLRGTVAGPPVISLSHLALPYSPGNPHYGAGGDYRNTLHYAHDADETALSIASDERLFAASPAACYGEKNLIGHGRVLRRLTWNPDFDGMVREIGEFLARIEQ